MKLQGIITATIAVIMIMLIAVPLIDDASKTVYSVENNPNAQYNMNSGEKLTITGSAPNYVLNGTPLDSYNGYYLIVSDNIFISEGSAQTIIVDAANNNRIQTPSEVTFTAENGTWSYTYGSTTKTGSYSFLFYPEANGPYGLYANTPGYMTKGETGYIICPTGGSDPNYRPCFIAEIKDKAVTSILSDPFILTTGNVITPIELSPSDISLNVDDSKDLELSDWYGSNNRVTYNGTSQATINLMLPVEYKILTENESTILTILGLIPVLLIVALVIGIGYEVARRD